ncbi:MAG: hypothetical protein DRJ41_03710 [Thermoprotei archaeon]|nr:MAG: hypothetical protein DRJ41_03710 [Thermoprotei archaeon]
MDKSERILKLILSSRPDLNREKLIRKIERRIEELGGLLSFEAAAMLVAKELGVPLPKEEILSVSTLKIKDIIGGLKGITLVSRVVKVSKLREVGENTGLKNVKIVLGDETGIITLTLWGDLAREVFKTIKPGDIVVIERAFAKKYKDKIELGLEREGKIYKKDNSEEKLPNLEYFLERYDLKTFIGTILWISKLEKENCIVCIDNKGNLIKLIIKDLDNLNNLKIGDKVLFQDYIGTLGKKAYLSNFSRMIKIAEEKTKPLTFNSITPSKLMYELDKIKEGDLICIKGYIGAVIPYRSKGGDIFIFDDEYTIKISTFNDNFLEDIFSKNITSSIELKFISLLKKKKIPVFRIDSCSYINIGEKNIFNLKKDYEKSFLIEAVGPVEVNAAILSLRLGYRFYNNNLNLGVIAKIDDGTAQAFVVTNNNKFIEKILNMSIDEMKMYIEQKTLFNKIVDYLVENTKGKDFTFKGWFCKNKILIVL